MRITDVRKRRGKLYLLFLDGEEAMTVDALTFDESPYRMGGSITDEELYALLEESRRRRAREKALYLLSLRDYGRAELEKKLRDEAGEDAAAEAAGRMEELGLLDDRRYAARLAGDCVGRRCFPRRRAVQELTGRGIARDLAEEAVDEALQEAEKDDRLLALELLRKKYYNRLCDEDARRKTMAALARYGFGYEAARFAVETALTEKQDEDEGGR